VVPAPAGRSLRTAGERALGLLAEIHGESPSGSGEGSPEASTGAGVMDSQASVHDAPLTYANHPDVTSPMTNARLDDPAARRSRDRAPSGPSAPAVTASTPSTTRPRPAPFSATPRRASRSSGPSATAAGRATTSSAAPAGPAPALPWYAGAAWDPRRFCGCTSTATTPA
jgi:hypothetical protein